MSTIPLPEQLQAVTIAHAALRTQVRQRQRACSLKGVELELQHRQVMALRAARETLVTLISDEAPGRARLHHAAMVAAHRGADLSDPTEPYSEHQ